MTLHEYKRNTRSVATASTTVIGAMLLLVIAVLSIWLWNSRERVERRVEERTLAAAKIVSTNARWIDSLAWQALQRIDDSLGSSISIEGDFEVKDINEAVRDLPGEVQAYVIDQYGRTIYSTDPKTGPLDLTDRFFFQDLVDGKKQHVSSLLVSRQNGEQIFVFSHRLRRGGQFAGAAVVSFEVDLLGEVWEAVTLGDKSIVSIIRDDGQLVARYPHAAGPVDMSSYSLFTEHLPKSSSGTYLAISSPVDATRRMVGYHTVEGTRYIALASSDYGLAMQGFWNDALVACLIILAAGVGSIAAGAWIRHLLKRDAVTSDRLMTALEENRLLLREIHHRVKNNLQSVQAIVRMQKLPPLMQRSLNGRIASMMTVHEQIYGHDQFDRISIDQLLPALVETVVNAHDSSIATSYDLDKVTVSADQATSLALLVNEVVTNSLKYGLSADGGGALKLELKDLGGGRARLTVADNGPGFEPQQAGKGMGTRLIHGVVSQLNGRFEYHIDKGTAFVAEIQLDKPDPRQSAA